MILTIHSHQDLYLPMASPVAAHCFILVHIWNTVLFRPTLRPLWPVTTTKRWASLRRLRWGVTIWTSLHRPKCGLNNHCAAWQAKFLSISSVTVVTRDKSTKFLSISSVTIVTRDKSTKSSLRRSLWPVTEELVKMVQYYVWYIEEPSNRATTFQNQLLQL